MNKFTVAFAAVVALCFVNVSYGQKTYSDYILEVQNDSLVQHNTFSGIDIASGLFLDSLAPLTGQLPTAGPGATGAIIPTTSATDLVATQGDGSVLFSGSGGALRAQTTSGALLTASFANLAGNGNPNGSEPVAISIWAQADVDLRNSPALFENAIAPGVYQMGIYRKVFNNETIEFVYDSNQPIGNRLRVDVLWAGTFFLSFSDDTFDMTQTHHYVLTIDPTISGTTATLYVDTVVRAVAFSPNTTYVDGASSPWLGTTLSSGKSWSGLIDEYSVWAGRALTASDISDINRRASENRFIRGDVNGSGNADIGDVGLIAPIVFSGAPVDCRDAVDTNDDGVLTLADAIYLATALFSGGPPPPAPFTVSGGLGACGFDPVADSLDCETSLFCP